jgi:hypothetical protein
MKIIKSVFTESMSESPAIQNKYLKYKQKYFNLKKMIGGGINATYTITGVQITLSFFDEKTEKEKEIKYTIQEKLPHWSADVIVYKIKKDDDHTNTFIFKKGINSGEREIHREGENSNLLKNILDDDMLVLFQGTKQSEFLISTYNGNDLYQEFKEKEIKEQYANVTTQLLDLLHKINSRDIFHNDIKLANITIKDGKVYLIDFELLTKGESNYGTLVSMSFNGVIALLEKRKYNKYETIYIKLKPLLKNTDMVGFFYCCFDLLFLSLANKYLSSYIFDYFKIYTAFEDEHMYKLFDLFFFILPESDLKKNILETPDYSDYSEYKNLPSEEEAKSIFGNFPDENTNLFRFMAFIYSKIKIDLIKNKTQQIWYKDFLKIMSACFLPEFNYDKFETDFKNIVSKFSELPEIQEDGFGSDSIPAHVHVGVPEYVPDMLQREIDIINIIFPESDFKMEYDNSDFSISTLDNNYCIGFSISRPHNIDIYTLNKCGRNITGTILLEKINILAQKLNIESISVLDTSNILECSIQISLSTIKILTKGESWYNSLGYKSTHYEYEVNHNNKIINMPYSEFKKKLLTLYIEQLKNKNSQKILKLKQSDREQNIDKLIKSAQKYEFQKYELERKKAEYETYQKQIKEYDTFISTLISEKEKEYTKLIDTTIFSDIDVNSNVKDYFTSIWSQIKRNDCNEIIIKQLEWLSNIISIIDTSKILQYDKVLIKKVIRESPAIQNKYLKYKQKYLNLKNQLG